MLNKILRFLEEHAEKIVLALVGVVCMYLLLSRVVFSPNTVEYDGRTFSPGAIDEYIAQQEQELREKLTRDPEALESPQSQLPLFVAELDSSLSEVNADLWPVMPRVPEGGAGGTRSYPRPEIGVVYDSAVDHLRAVAYVPTVEVTPENPYEKNIPHEPNDVDLVTVQAKFDVAELYKEFFESYAGDDVRPEWRDPCYAEPVFAAVDLQRQRLLEDGTWTDWQRVPRAKIDHRKDLFTIVDEPEELPPGGLKVRLLQYRNKETQIDLLQPRAYQIASAKEEWFPPELHEKFERLQGLEELEARRKEYEERQNETTSGRTGGRLESRTGRRGAATSRSRGSEYGGAYGATGRRGRESGRRTRGSAGGQLGEMYGDMQGGRRGRRGRGTDGDLMMEEDMLLYGEPRELSNRPSTDDVYVEFDEILLRRDMDLSELNELVFWALDDTAEPKNTYRYRIRLGVFNPAAGPQASDLIFWSGFSDVTDPVRIPGRMYFFALATQDAGQAVRVEVAKYVLGYWYTEFFKVQSGELIGELRELQNPDRRDTRTVRDFRSPRTRDSFDQRITGVPLSSDRPAEPEEIDYNTGALMVDVAAVADWAGEPKMSPRQYENMLYSYDGADIEHMGIGQQYWPVELKTAFADISTAQREKREPLRPWEESLRRRGPMPGTFEMEGGEIDEEMYEQMMMMEMGNY